MEDLTNEIKLNTRVEVNLNYHYQHNTEMYDKLEQVKEYLQACGLTVDLAEGRYYGLCYNLTCLAEIDLLLAEQICQNLNDMCMHCDICYYKGQFHLIA